MKHAKKYLSIVLSLVISILSFQLSEVKVNAVSSIVQHRLNNAIVLYIGSPKAFVNNVKTNIDTSDISVSPLVKEGNTLVPVRFVSENFGAEVSWNEETSTAVIKIGSKTAWITLGSKNMVLDGKVKQLSVPAEMINGRLFIPLRKLVEDVIGKKVFFYQGLIIISNEENIFNLDTEKSYLEEIISSFLHPSINNWDGVVNFSSKLNPDTLDPHSAIFADERTYIVHILEGLTKVGKNGEIVPGIAESWDISESGTIITFHIRDSFWSDGQPVKAQDFEYAWKRLLDPQKSFELAYMLYDIKNAVEYNNSNATEEVVGVKALNDKALEVTLQNPTAYFFSLTQLPYLMPLRQDLIEEYGYDWGKSSEGFVSNGAFMIKEWKKDSTLVLVKNEDYWDKKNIMLKEINIKLTENENEILDKFNHGEIHYIYYNTTTPSNMSAYSKSLQIYNSNSIYYLEFNTKKPPLDDKRVRKALAYSIDRRELIDTELKSQQIPADGIIPYGMAGENPNKDFRTEIQNNSFLPESADIITAKKLLSEAGYPEGKDFPEIELLYNDNIQNKLIMEGVAKQWRNNLGIPVKVTNVSLITMLDRINNQDFYIARRGWIPDFNDPMAIFELWYTGRYMYNSTWNCDEYDNLVITALKTMNQKIRMEAMHQAEKIIMDEMPICPIYYYINSALKNSNLKCEIVTADGIVYFHYAKIE